MRIHLRKVGNSQGVIIPIAALEACDCGEEIEMRLEGKSLVIEAVKSQRSGWFDGYLSNADADAWETLPVDESSEEWQW
jgi:antitoxin MazE